MNSRALLSTFLLVIILPNLSIANKIDTTKYISAEKLIASGILEAEIIGIGGHEGNCIQLSAKNTSNDSVFIWIEAGRRLASEDEGTQDILIMKNQLLALGPKQKDSTEVFGFCCQSHNASPGSKTRFKIGVMAPIAWIILANFVDQNEFPLQATQEAVWVLSDGHDLGSIHDEDQEKILPLKRKVAELIGLEVPWYSFTYHEADEGQLFSNNHHKVHGLIEFYLGTNAVLTFVIQDEYGFTRCNIIPDGNYGPGDYTLELQKDVTGWPKGKYTIIVIQDYSFPLKKQTFYIK